MYTIALNDPASGEGGQPADGGSASQACTDYVAAFCSRYKTAPLTGSGGSMATTPPAAPAT
jgi:hypothetical protein